MCHGGGLQFSSRPQPLQHGRGGPEGGGGVGEGSKIFLHFGGIFESPFSFWAFWIYTSGVKIGFTTHNK